MQSAWLGLPLGLDVVLSDPTGIYDPNDSEFGCANVSGTPLVSGDYTITISIQANVTVVGVDISVDQLVNFEKDLNTIFNTKKLAR